MTIKKKRPPRPEPVVEIVEEPIDFDAWVRAYVARVIEGDGWRVADPPSVSVA